MNLIALQQMAGRGEKIAVLTAYDASFATLCEKAGVEVLLVGDSLGMVLQGAASTLGVTLHDTIQALVVWTEEHQNEIAAARSAYDAKQNSEMVDA